MEKNRKWMKSIEWNFVFFFLFVISINDADEILPKLYPSIVSLCSLKHRATVPVYFPRGIVIKLSVSTSA